MMPSLSLSSGLKKPRLLSHSSQSSPPDPSSSLQPSFGHSLAVLCPFCIVAPQTAQKGSPIPSLKCLNQWACAVMSCEASLSRRVPHYQQGSLLKLADGLHVLPPNNKDSTWAAHREGNLLPQTHSCPTTKKKDRPRTPPGISGGFFNATCGQNLCSRFCFELIS